LKVRYLKNLVDIPAPPADWDPSEGGRWVVLSLDDLTDGGVYEVISVERGLYRILDDSGEDYLYGPGIFETVEALPPPPVLTEEDFSRGRSGRYMAAAPYADCLRGRSAGELAVAESSPVYGRG